MLRPGHGGAIAIGIDQRTTQLVQRPRHRSAPVEIHLRRQQRKKRRITPQRLALQHVHPMPETGHRVGYGVIRFIAGEHQRRRCRLRREEAAAAPGHRGRKRLTQPAPGLAGRHQQKRGAQVSGAAGFTGEQTLRSRGQQRPVPGQIGCFGGGAHSFAQFYWLVSHGANDTTSPGTKTVSCENSWHERGICLTNRLGCVDSGSCGRFSPEQIIREHGSENKLPTAQPLLGGP